MLKIIIAHGGLGNQMFGYAFACSLKKNHPISFVSLDMLEPWDAHNGYELLKVFKNVHGHSFRFYRRQLKLYSKFNTKRLFTSIKEEEVDYGSYNINYLKKSSLFNIYDGFWQTEKYFKNAERTIRKKFCFDIDRLNEKSNILLTQIKKQNSVSIHIRRGDYLLLPYYFEGTCDLDYYKKAIDLIAEKYPDSHYYFFSDEMDWVIDNFSELDATFVDWNKKDDSWQDMFLMSRCKHNVIANSSFSWWGAWLNNNPSKTVIAPKKWFKDIKATDIIPSEWICL